MKTLVWISYGSANVYLADPTNIESIKGRVHDRVQCYSDHQRADLLNCTSFYQIEQWVKKHTNDDDTFEHFEFVDIS